MGSRRTPFTPDASGLDRARFWMMLTPAERRGLAVILAIAWIGLCVRWWHRRQETPSPVDIESLAQPP